MNIPQVHTNPLQFIGNNVLNATSTENSSQIRAENTHYISSYGEITHEAIADKFANLDNRADELSEAVQNARLAIVGEDDANGLQCLMNFLGIKKEDEEKKKKEADKNKDKAAENKEEKKEEGEEKNSVDSAAPTDVNPGDQDAPVPAVGTEKGAESGTTAVGNAKVKKVKTENGKEHNAIAFLDLRIRVIKDEKGESVISITSVNNNDQKSDEQLEQFCELLKEKGKNVEDGGENAGNSVFSEIGKHPPVRYLSLLSSNSEAGENNENKPTSLKLKFPNEGVFSNGAEFEYGQYLLTLTKGIEFCEQNFCNIFNETAGTQNQSHKDGKTLICFPIAPIGSTSSHKDIIKEACAKFFRNELKVFKYTGEKMTAGDVTGKSTVPSGPRDEKTIINDTIKILKSLTTPPKKIKKEEDAEIDGDPVEAKEGEDNSNSIDRQIENILEKIKKYTYALFRKEEIKNEEKIEEENKEEKLKKKEGENEKKEELKYRIEDGNVKKEVSDDNDDDNDDNDDDDDDDYKKGVVLKEITAKEMGTRIDEIKKEIDEIEKKILGTDEKLDASKKESLETDEKLDASKECDARRAKCACLNLLHDEMKKKFLEDVKKLHEKENAELHEKFFNSIVSTIETENLSNKEDDILKKEAQKIVNEDEEVLGVDNLFDQ
jgi:hypothetical protein